MECTDITHSHVVFSWTDTVVGAQHVFVFQKRSKLGSSPQKNIYCIALLWLWSILLRAEMR